MELQELLESTGMGKYKSDAYLGLLIIKTGTIQEISKNCKVPSCKLYECMKWLHERGYATVVSQNPIKYRANNPKEAIIQDLSDKMENLQAVWKKADALKLKVPPSEKGIIQITTTRKSFFEKMKECAKQTDTYMHYMVKNWKYDADLLRILKERVENGIELKALGPVNSKTINTVKLMRKIGVKVKNYDPKSTRFSVYDDKLVIIALRKKDMRKEDYTAAYIESDVLAEIMEEKFETLWKQSI